MANFASALSALKAGVRAWRNGWNGKGQFVYLVPGSTFEVNRPPLLGILPAGTEVRYHAHIDFKSAQGYCVPWIASHTDALSSDWEFEDYDDTPPPNPRSLEANFPALLTGQRLSRSGWNGAGMYIRLQPKLYDFLPYVALRVPVTGKFVAFSWAQQDLLGEDWDIAP